MEQRIENVLNIAMAAATRGIPPETISLALLRLTIKLAKKAGITEREFFEEAGSSWKEVER